MNADFTRKLLEEAPTDFIPKRLLPLVKQVSRSLAGAAEDDARRQYACAHNAGDEARVEPEEGRQS
jgi:hypothetical protein